MSNLKVKLIKKMPIPKTYITFGTSEKDFIEILEDTIFLMVKPQKRFDTPAINRAGRLLSEYFGPNWHAYFELEIKEDKN